MTNMYLPGYISNFDLHFKQNCQGNVIMHTFPVLYAKLILLFFTE